MVTKLRKSIDRGDASCKFFATPGSFRLWLADNHNTATQLWVGFHKVATGKPSLTWPQSVDEALCFGWIDGIRKRIDDHSYCIRFTPRKRGSIWSAVNIKRVAVLTAAGRMRKAGTAAFKLRVENKSGIYAYEQRPRTLGTDFEKEFRQNEAAWNYFNAKSPSYRRTAIWWVISAKQEATRLRRLARLIDDSAHGRTLAQLTR